jgi:hypothetical protein
MSDPYVGYDSLRIYHSGASSLEVTQGYQEECLGGFKSSTIATTKAFVRTDPFQSVRIESVSPASLVGVGSLDATSEVAPGGFTIYKMAWTPPGGTQGAFYEIDSTSTVLLPGADPNDYIIVERVNSQPLNGSESVQVMDVYENVLSMGEYGPWDTSNGPRRYRAFFLTNISNYDLSTVTLSADATAFGAESTNVVIRLGTETPVSGEIQTLDTELDVPVAISLTSSPIVIPTLVAAESIGIWLEIGRSGEVISPHVEIVINCTYTQASPSPISATTTFKGLSRFYDEDRESYVVYIKEGSSPDPEVDLPTIETQDTTASYYADWPDGTYYVKSYRRNRYNLLSTYLKEKVFVVDSGSVTEDPPSNAVECEVSNAADGKFIINAVYYPFRESADQNEVEDIRATHWRIYYTSDGSDPTLLTTPQDTVVMTENNGRQFLNWISLVAFPEDTVIQAVVRPTRISGDTVVEADDDATYSVTIVRSAQLFVVPSLAYGKNFGRELTRPVEPEDTTTYVSEDPLIYFITTSGDTQLWAENTLIFRCNYPSGLDLDGVIYFPSNFSFIAQAMIGTSTNPPDEPIEVGAWTESHQYFYICVNGMRKMMVDVVNKQIKTASWQLYATMPNIYPQEVIWPRAGDTLIQVWSKTLYMFIPCMSVDSSGVFKVRVAVDQTYTQAEILAL